MALIKCPECKKKVSDQCGICPHCGYSIQNHIQQQPQDCNTEQKREKKSSDKGKKKRVLIVMLISVVIIAMVIAFVFVLKPIIIRNGEYNDAVALMEAGKYSEAIDAFTKLDGYEDSADLIEDCKTKILEEQYIKAVKLMEAENYQQAMSEFSKLGGYKDSAAKFEECKELLLLIRYNAAIALLDKGDVVGAYEAFLALGTYKDSANKAASLYDKYQAEKRKEQLVQKLASANVNATVQFGTYEQDNLTANGAEPIKWTVAKKEGSKILLVSNVLLDVMEYDENNSSYTWEDCSLRKWLNNDFWNTAFSIDEKELIATTNVSPEKNQYYTSVNPGSATKDKVFILSMSEVQEYCDPPALIYGYRCELTMYAREKHPGWFDGSIYGGWWVRSPGGKSGRIMYVQRDGDIDVYGCGPFNWLGIRPAVWIDLS